MEYLDKALMIKNYCHEAKYGIISLNSTVMLSNRKYIMQFLCQFSFYFILYLLCTIYPKI
jgi:hypothetical protein